VPDIQDLELELELAYVVNVSQLLTKRSMSGAEWNHGKVGVTATDIWLPEKDGWDMIPFKSIEMVGRQLTGSIGNQILQATKYSNVLVVDYKKQSLFGTGQITATMIFAGQGRDIRNLKNYLLSVLGFRVDASFGELELEESRLLCLLGAGMNDVNVLLPVFDSNKILLKHAFIVLKKRGLVDEYAGPTQLGLEYVEQVKGKGEGKLGSDIDKAFGAVAKTWKHVDTFRPAKRMNKVLWKHEEFSLGGRVPNNQLWQCIPVADVGEMEIDENDSGAMYLHIRTKYDTSVYVEPVEKSTVFTLYGMLDRNEDIEVRVLCSIYLGITQHNIIAHILNIQPLLLGSKMEQMARKGWIDSQNNVVPKGMDIMRDLIYKKSSGKEEKPIEEETGRLEELKKDDAMKRVLGKLGGT